MKQRTSWSAGGRVALLALGLGCGADSVNVGDRPEPVGGGDGSSAPDAGGSLVDGDTRCNIPNLGQYRLLFDSDGGRLERRIYSMRADGTEIEPLTAPEELAREPALSPDGNQLAYATPEGIVLRDIPAGQAELLVPGGDQPKWSLDGKRIYYRAVATYCVHSVTMPDRVFSAPDAGLGCSRFTPGEMTPDGSSYIYVAAQPREGIVFEYSLVLHEVDTRTQVDLVPPAGIPIEYPRVSPDGLWVAAAYECDGGGISSLWASPLSVRTTACEGRRITRAGNPSSTKPQWGPSGFITYERGEPPRDIAIIAADSGEECVIAGLGDDRNPSMGVFTTVIPE